MSNLSPKTVTALAIALSMAAFGSCWLFSAAAAAQQTPQASFDPIGAETPPRPAAPEPAGDEASPDQPGDDQPRLSFNFRFAPWDQVLTKFADVAGLTLDLSDTPPGTFNYYDTGQYTPREALDVLNGYLLQRGYLLVRRDRFLVCLNTAKGIPPHLVPLVPLETLADYGNNELVTVILPLDDGDAADVAGQLEPILGPHHKVAVMQAADALVVTDTAGNLRRVQQLLQHGALGRQAAGAGEPTLEVFALRFIRASDAEELLRDVFALPPASAEAANGAARRGAASGLRIASDARGNRLFVTATPADLRIVKQIVESLDVASGDGGPAGGGPARTVRIVPLGGADVIVIGRALESLTPRIRVSTTSSRRPPAPAGEAADEPSSEQARPPATNQRPSPPETPRPNGRDGR